MTCHDMRCVLMSIIAGWKLFGFLDLVFAWQCFRLLDIAMVAQRFILCVDVRCIDHMILT
jgi:hypothetical protein